MIPASAAGQRPDGLPSVSTRPIRSEIPMTTRSTSGTRPAVADSHRATGSLLAGRTLRFDTVLSLNSTDTSSPSHISHAGVLERPMRSRCDR